MRTLKRYAKQNRKCELPEYWISWVSRRIMNDVDGKDEI